MGSTSEETNAAWRAAHELLVADACSRLARLLERQGLQVRDPDYPWFNLEPGSSFDQRLGAAIHYRIAMGPHAGHKALTLYTVPPDPGPGDAPLLASQPGFSLQAATVCEALQRLKRVFAIDIETCPECGGKLRIIACIEDPQVIARILSPVR